MAFFALTILSFTTCKLDRLLGPETPATIEATKLVFDVQPSTVAANGTITPAVRVKLTDADGNLATEATTSITIAITSGTGTTGAVLNGTKTVLASAGIATFSTLGVDRAGTGYTFTATGASLTSATSSAFAVTGAATIVLTPTSRAFTANVGAANPAAQTVAVTNGGAGTLSNLALGTITYGAGASGWLAASISTTTAPATVTLTPTTGTLTAGTYTATVPVTSTVAGVTNSPQNISVTFTVSQAPTITLSATTRTYSATAGGTNPAAQTVNITNTGTGTLDGLAVGTITYGAGASGWLSTSLSTATAPSVLTITPTLGVLTAGTYTATVPVTSTANGVTNSPQNVSVTFTVAAPSGPAIGLSPSSRTFAASTGGANPATQTVAVTNVGSGTLNNLAIGTITYGAGGTGWLAASLSTTTAPATITLTPTTGSLAAGTYTATVPVTSTATGITNSPQNISVTFTVSAPTNPTIAVSSTSPAFSATVGGANPAGQTINITNSGGGTLNNLAIGTITYGTGGTGWLAFTLSGTTAPATVTLTATTGSLAAGTYTATVPVTSTATGVTNSPLNMTVTFTVTSTTPTIVLTPTSRTFTANVGGASPATQTVAVSNGGGGTLNGLATGTITYGAGQTTGWLAASINQATAPATVTLTATTGSLVAGTYTATVPVTSTATGVTNSPQNISVTFTVSSTTPTIVLTPTSQTFTDTIGTANPAAKTVAVTNGGAGTLNGLAIGTITYGAGGSGWLSASLDVTTAPATVTLQASIGSLVAGTYTATVPVTSTATGVTNSPQNISVTFVVVAQQPTILLTPSSRTFTGNVGGANPATQTVAVSNGGGGTLNGLATGTITYGAGATAWLAASINQTTAPATVTLTATTGSLAAGTYTATVPVTSTASGITNSPQNISVTFTVSSTPPTIALTPTSRSFAATSGGSNPSTQSVTVTNSGGGTLNGLAIGTITYGTGATGWLVAQLDQTVAPAIVTLIPATGTLTAGTYTATVPVTSSATGVTNSPQNISVTFTVSGSGPSIGLSPNNRSFTSFVGGASPASQTVTVSNSGTGGSGGLTNLAVGTITYGAGASAWLAASISGTTSPATVTMTATTGSLAAGTYTATVPITSSQTGVTNSPQNIAVTFTIGSSDPCSPTAYTIGNTFNGSLLDGDCDGPMNPRDIFSFTTSAAATFFSANVTSNAFSTRQIMRIWTGTTNSLIGGVGPLYYLVAPGTYQIDAARTGSATGAYQLTSTLNPTLASGCQSTLVTRNVSATQQLDSSCVINHDPATDVPNARSSVRQYYIWQAAGQAMTIRMSSTTIDTYLEAYNFSVGGFLAFNDDESGTNTNSVLTLAAPATGRFVRIHAGHYPEGSSALVVGTFTLTIDP